jgi:signal transduction histidine kinase
LGLEECLAGEVPRTAQLPFGGAPGRWRIQRLSFRQSGLPHQLLVLSDLSRELREEERQAWQRLVRVLGHELNNSLAPVISIAASLSRLLQRDPRPADWEQDARDGLQVIGSRAESLERFVGAYAQLARLPRPRPQAVDLRRLAGRVADLETRLPIFIEPSPDVPLEADPDQLEQVLINLVRNAADAVLGIAEGDPVPAPGVRMGWTRTGSEIEIWVEDDGPGLAGTANLFVPFFTTKPRGSGIGLVLCQQIAEGHGGSLTLENRVGARGCRARLRLPAGAGRVGTSPSRSLREQAPQERQVRPVIRH